MRAHPLPPPRTPPRAHPPPLPRPPPPPRPLPPAYPLPLPPPPPPPPPAYPLPLPPPPPPQVKIGALPFCNIVAHGQGNTSFGLLRGCVTAGLLGRREIIINNIYVLPDREEPFVVIVPSTAIVPGRDTVPDDVVTAVIEFLGYNEEHISNMLERRHKDIVGWYISAPEDMLSEYGQTQALCQQLQEPFICVIFTSKDWTMKAKRRSNPLIETDPLFDELEISYFNTSIEENCLWDKYPLYNDVKQIQLEPNLKKLENNCAKAETMMLQFVNYGLTFQFVILSTVVAGSFSCFSSPSFSRYYWLPLLLVILGSLLYVHPLVLITSRYKTLKDTLEIVKLEFSTRNQKERARVTWVLVSLICMFVALILMATLIIPGDKLKPRNVKVDSAFVY